MSQANEIRQGGKNEEQINDFITNIIKIHFRLNNSAYHIGSISHQNIFFDSNFCIIYHNFLSFATEKAYPFTFSSLQKYFLLI